MNKIKIRKEGKVFVRQYKNELRRSLVIEESEIYIDQIGIIQICQILPGER